MIENFLESLKIMGFGMSGIFIVILIIYFIIVLLNKIFTVKPKNDE